MLDQMQPDQQPRRQRRTALLGKELAKACAKRVPVDPLRQKNHRMRHVDDVLQPAAEEFQIRLIEKGCGSAAGKLEFFEDSLIGQNNSFVKSFEGLRANIEAAPNIDVRIDRCTVDVVRLDDEPGSVAPNFIKIDVEGYELPVFQGAHGWFYPGRKPPIIMIEVQADHDEIGDWMHERGYTLFDVDGQEISAIPHSTLNIFALNCEQHTNELSRWRSQQIETTKQR